MPVVYNTPLMDTAAAPAASEVKPADSLDANEVIVPAPALISTTPKLEIFEGFPDIKIPSLEHGNGDASFGTTLIAILICLWIAKLILGLIPRFLLIGIGIAILYTFMQ